MRILQELWRGARPFDPWRNYSFSVIFVLVGLSVPLFKSLFGTKSTAKPWILIYFISFPLDIGWARPLCQVMLCRTPGWKDESNVFLATGSSHWVDFKRKSQNNKVLTHTYEIILFSQRTAKLFCSHLLWQNKWRFSDLMEISKA